MNLVLSGAGNYDPGFLKNALWIMVILSAVVALIAIFSIVLLIKSKRNFWSVFLVVSAFVALVVVLGLSVYCSMAYKDQTKVPQAATTPTTEPPPTTTEPPTEPEPEPTPGELFSPTSVDSTDPEKMGIKWEIIVDGQIVESYQREAEIRFRDTEVYTEAEGIISFRGNNYRNTASYGTANVKKETLTDIWSGKIGSLNDWPGSGWTGQPLIVRWDSQTRQVMNLYQEKKDKEDLVEVIYATLDGYVYFYDLEDGTYTRDPMFLGMNFKGAGSLDPRGYPLMYVGSGDYYNQAPRMYIVNLIDCTIAYEQSGADDFALRGWYAFDSAPLVHGQTDTLIWPGESGLLYTMQLNTQYDPVAGTISVAPSHEVKVRYSTGSGRSLGVESSCLIVENYLFMGDNGGYFFCVDLNTMRPVWMQDTKDDVNATPVFEWGEDGNGYIYTASSMEYENGTCYLYKLNAQTGEILWEKSYDGIIYDKAVSGGVLSSPILGKEGTELEGMIIYSVAKTPNAWKGTLVALNTATGEVIWEKELSNYCWSSPVPLYTNKGRAYVVLCDSTGKVHLIDGASGEILQNIHLGSNIESSPAAFENILVVGTRGQKVYGMKVE